MLHQPPAEAGILQPVMFVGPIVQWVAALLLFIIFALFLPLSSQRRVIVTWSIAWAAQAVSLIDPVAVNTAMIFGRSAPMWATVFKLVSWSAQFVFLIAIGIGAL